MRGYVGVADPIRIKDAQMTASTVRSSNFELHDGRVNSTRGPQTWCPATNTDPSNYLQVDIGSVKSLCTVHVQKQGTGGFYTATYYLKYSLDNKVWNTYKENNEKR